MYDICPWATIIPPAVVTMQHLELANTAHSGVKNTAHSGVFRLECWHVVSNTTRNTFLALIIAPSHAAMGVAPLQGSGVCLHLAPRAPAPDFFQSCTSGFRSR